MDWHVEDGAVVKTVGVSETTSAMTTITDSGGANSKGNWTQITASSPMAADGILLVTSHVGAANPSILMDISIGAVGSENNGIIVNDWLFGDSIDSTAFTTRTQVYFPLMVPAASNISLRYQATSAGLTVTAALMLIKNGFAATTFSKCTTYGANTTDSGGTQLDAGATANAKGAWTVISETTGMAARAILIGNHYPATSTGTQNLFLELGTGASGSEQTIMSHYHIRHLDTFRTAMPGTYLSGFPIPINIPAVSRLTGRLQCSSNIAARRVQDIVVYAFS